jgi:AMP-binding enzyme
MYALSSPGCMTTMLVSPGCQLRLKVAGRSLHWRVQNSRRLLQAATIWPLPERKNAHASAVPLAAAHSACKPVCLQANWLRSVGVKKGDAVCIYMPMLPELPIAMLACARIGAVHSVVFAGFSSESLAQRIEDCNSNVVITCNGACCEASVSRWRCVVMNHSPGASTTACPVSPSADILQPLHVCNRRCLPSSPKKVLLLLILQ